MDNWISVNERLPEDETDVFFLEVINGAEEYTGFLPGWGYFLDGSFYDWYDHERSHKDNITGNTRVTHWLPQPDYPDIKTTIKN